MRVISIVEDKRIKAYSVLVEIKADDYLAVAQDILKKNDFQRRRVKGSKSVYSLLRRDLKSGCTIPPLVMAVNLSENEAVIDKEKCNDEYVTRLFTSDNVIILDGLQRTYTLLEVRDELKADEEALKRFNNMVLRVELYFGINRVGILYRMLTLNTGQTPMSTRHQIEILYSDLLNKKDDEIEFIRQVDQEKIDRLGKYNFDDVVEGFNSYLTRDELAIDRNDILENIQNLEKLAEENAQDDVFSNYISTYTQLARKWDSLAGDWTYTPAPGEKAIESPFSKDVIHIFSKPQTMSAFGAAVGSLKDNEYITTINGFGDVHNSIGNLQMGGEVAEVMNDFIKKMSEVRKGAKKIGVEQRRFLLHFFKILFQPDGDQYLSISKAIEEGFRRYNATK